MLIGETVAVALQSIKANALRSILTALGIIIGVAAVITMVALGTGAQRAVEDQIASLGANVLSVYPGMSFSSGVASTNRVSLTIDDADALERDGQFIKAVVPEIVSHQQVKYINKNGEITDQPVPAVHPSEPLRAVPRNGATSRDVAGNSQAVL